jgi:WD40 repeat protein
VVAAGIVVLILAIMLASKPSSFTLFPTATVTASLIPLPTLTITPSGTPEPTLTPTETITPSPMPTPTTMVMNVPQTTTRISRANLNSLELLATWGLPFMPVGVDISADNQKIVFVGDDAKGNGFVDHRNIQTGEEENLVFFPYVNNLEYPSPRVSAVKFLPSGNLAILMMQSDALFIYDQAGNQVNQFFIKNYGDLTKALDVSPDGRLIAAGGCCEISIWDAESGTLVMSIAGPYSNTNPVLSLVFSKDGKSVFAKSPDGYVRIWDAQNGNLLKEMWGQAGFLFALDVSPTGTYLASGSVRSENYQDTQYSGDIRIWRISDGQQVCVTIPSPNLN